LNTILIIDDDDPLRRSFHKLLTEEGYQVKSAAAGEAGLDMIQKEIPDLVVLDMRLPGMNGLETFQAIQEIEPRLPVIIMTAYGTTEIAIEATRMGAFDYILKPFDIPDMLTVIQQAIDAGHFMRSPVEMDVAPDSAFQEAIIGRSNAMQEVYKAIGRVSSTNATVLIRGESGTGKELAARAIYQHSLRKHKPFLVINCVAIPETLLESELFGYEKGAFTGATHRRIGKVEQARSGTLFLDEIGDMPLGLQAKLLRFREDLYYRLKVVTIWLPPLRKHPDDIPLLADYFLSRHAKEMSMENPGITKATKALLTVYPWPGNVRELSNIIQKALIFNRGAPLRPEDITHAIDKKSSGKAIDDYDNDKSIQQWVRHELTHNPRENMFDSIIDQIACKLISETLNLTAGNRSRAAKILGLSRPTLHSKIEKYRLKLETYVSKDTS